MKKITITLLYCAISSSVLSQQFTPKGGGEFTFNNENLECLTEDHREQIKLELKESTEKLKAQNAFESLDRGTFPGFIWPVVKASGFEYNGVWGISGFMDHNTSYPNQLTDYNCGTRSYDTNSGYNHQGVDIFTWPFGWKLMDEDKAHVVAAAPGVIIFKRDGEFDRSCNFNNNPWNAVYVRHSNGSVAWYGHLKNGSVTSKNVGDTVVEGEYLGVVGSSGNSTGPHLHFEIWEDDTYTNLIDPYVGVCNSTTSSSWWQSQKPYNDSGVNAVLTHTAAPNFGTCPTQETTNESNQFAVNEFIYFAIYLRDQIAGTQVNLKVIRPDNSILYDWNYDLVSNYYSSWWLWNFNTLDIEGEWKWQATYGGETVTHTFNVGTLSTTETSFQDTKIFPNPSTGELNIQTQSFIESLRLSDILGREVLKERSESGIIKKIDISQLPNGVYFATVKGKDNRTKTIKIIKE